MRMLELLLLERKVYMTRHFRKHPSLKVDLSQQSGHCYLERARVSLKNGVKLMYVGRYTGRFISFPVSFLRFISSRECRSRHEENRGYIVLILYILNKFLDSAKLSFYRILAMGTYSLGIILCKRHTVWGHPQKR